MKYQINYTRAFLKQYSKLSPSIKNKAKKSISIFELNPKDESLKSHKLTGVLKDKYSFSVDYNYRIIFEIDKNNKCFVLLKIGSHEIYK